MFGFSHCLLIHMEKICGSAHGAHRCYKCVSISACKMLEVMGLSMKRARKTIRIKPNAHLVQHLVFPLANHIPKG